MILLAATVADGELLLSHGPGGERKEILIVTPGNSGRVRGHVDSHIYSTPKFDALPAYVQARVLVDALPTIASSPCERCHARWDGRDTVRENVDVS